MNLLPDLLLILTLFIRMTPVRSTLHHAVMLLGIVCIHDPCPQCVDGFPSTALDAGAELPVEDWSAGLFNERFTVCKQMYSYKYKFHSNSFKPGTEMDLKVPPGCIYEA